MVTQGIGLIGCGRIARLVHLNVLTHLPGTKLVALAEADGQRRAEAAARAPGATALADYRELLAHPGVDAVVIALPSGMHAEVATAAFAAGKHVYLEKPLADSLAAADQVIDAWQAAGTVGMIGFNYRANPLYIAARAQLKAGRIGQLVAVRGVFSAAPRELPAWKTRRASGGGALLDQAAHQLDLIHFLLDRPVRSVQAQVFSQRSEDDTAILQLNLAGDVPAQLLCALSAVEEDRLEFYGTAGKLSVDRFGGLEVRFTPARRPNAPLGEIVGSLRPLLVQPIHALKRLRNPGFEPSYAATLERFAAAMYGGPADPDLWAGYRSMRVVAAAEEAARSGRMVDIPEDVHARVAHP